VQYGFAAHDREVISSYYSQRTQGLPQGWPSEAEICRQDWKAAAAERHVATDCKKSWSRARRNWSGACRRCPQITAEW